MEEYYSTDARSVFDGKPFVVFAVDEHGVFTHSDGPGLGVLGLQAGEMVGRSAFEAYREEPSVVDNLRRVLSGEAFGAVVEVSGAVLECRYDPLKNDQGAVIGAAGMATVLSSCGRDRRPSRSSRAAGWFARFVESSPDLVTVARPDGSVRYVNPAVERLLGYSPEEFVEMSPDLADLAERIIHPDDRDLAVRELTEAAMGPTGPRPFVVAVRARHKDGSWRYFEGYVNNLVDDPDVGGLVFVSRDVNERVRAEEEARGLRERLEAMVEERTTALRAAVAELEENERALKESEERYRRLVENVREGIGFVGPEDGTIEYCNVAYARVLGLPPKEVVGRSFFDFVVEGQRGEALRHRELRLQGTGSSYELTITAADGGRKDLSCGGYPIFGPDGSYQGSVQTIVDVTERKRAEEALRLRDRAVASTSDGIVITDSTLPGDPIVYVNPAFERMTGYPAEEAIGKNYRFLQAEDRDQPALDELRTAVREGRECRVVLRNYRKDGTPFYNELSLSPLRDGEGRLTNFVGVQTDVTELRRTERALRESEERFRLAFDRAAVGMAYVSPDGGWIRVNDKLLEIVGYGREELSGLTFQDITHPDDLDADLEQVGRMLEGEIDEYAIEKRYLKKDRSRIWVRLSVSLIRDASGRPDHFVSVVEDVTGRKLAELITDPLTTRELEVLGLVARWKTNQEIARALNYSLGTVKLYVQRVIAKLGVKNRSQAAACAVELGLLPPPR